MREIKFKRVFQHNETGEICMTTWGNINPKNNPVDDFSSFKSPSYISGWHPIADVQFTGLKDKNGVDLFESDIVRWFDELDDATPHEVIKMDVHDSHSWGFLSFLTWNEFEIIGNIYENPELL